MGGGERGHLNVGTMNGSCRAPVRVAAGSQRVDECNCECHTPGPSCVASTCSHLHVTVYCPHTRQVVDKHKDEGQLALFRNSNGYRSVVLVCFTRCTAALLFGVSILDVAGAADLLEPAAF
jgi:hypothetical protein